MPILCFSGISCHPQCSAFELNFWAAELRGELSISYLPIAFTSVGSAGEGWESERASDSQQIHLTAALIQRHQRSNFGSSLCFTMGKIWQYSLIWFTRLMLVIAHYFLDMCFSIQGNTKTSEATRHFNPESQTVPLLTNLLNNTAKCQGVVFMTSLSLLLSSYIWYRVV